MEVSLQSHWIFVFHNFISVPTSFFCQQQWHLRDLLAHVYFPRVLTIEECNGIYTGKKPMFRVQCVDMVFVFCKEGMNSHFLFLSSCLLQCQHILAGKDSAVLCRRINKWSNGHQWCQQQSFSTLNYLTMESSFQAACESTFGDSGELLGFPHLLFLVSFMWWSCHELEECTNSSDLAMSDG
jgi:hypothetical protein